jgi:hypothetical protein
MTQNRNKSFFLLSHHSPSSKVSQLPSDEDLDMRTAAPSQPPSSTLGTSSTNPAISTRQTTSSKDDASIASGSSGCGSLTKKNKTQVTSGKNK